MLFYDVTTEDTRFIARENINGTMDTVTIDAVSGATVDIKLSYEQVSAIIYIMTCPDEKLDCPAYTKLYEIAKSIEIPTNE